MLLLALAPACGYALVMAVAVFQEGRLDLGRLDLVVLAVVLSYLLGAVAAIRWRNGEYGARFLLAAYSILVALAVAEVALRGLASKAPPGVPWPPMHRVSAAGDAMPGIRGTIEFTVNSLGLRGPEVDLDAVDLRILCVGGSSTESFYVTDKLSWPWLLQDRLAERLGRRVFVGNAGRSGHFSLHHDYLLNHYAPAAKFDWVIVLAGINDWGTLVHRRTYERRKTRIAQETLTAAHRGRPAYRALVLVQLLSSVGREAAVVQDPEGAWYATARAERRAALERRTLHEPPPDLDQALAVYRANLGRIAATTRARGQRLLLLTQPTLYRKDLPEELERLLWAYSDDGAYTAHALERMMDAFNAALLEVCRREALECLDLASMLSKDTSTFYDDVHFNISGSAKVAALVADFLVPRLTSGKPAANAGDVRP
jgi:lysophospholipase L1-like esterase